MSENTIPGALDAVRERWRLDKTVSGQTVVVVLLGFIGASLMNLVALIWMARGFVADLDELKAGRDQNAVRITALEEARQTEGIEKSVNASRMAVLENRAVTTEAAVLRVEADVKRLLDRRQQP